MTEKRLLLFDIDATLIASKGIWGRCFLEAIHEFFPQIICPSHVSFAGKTDLQVCQEIFEYSNVSLETMTEFLPKIITSYSKKAKKSAAERANEVDILPGVISLLNELQKMSTVTLSLLTGNIKVGAEVKLECKDLHTFFDFEIGAWGSDDKDRYNLPSIAVKRAEKKLGILFEKKEIVIIGDTIHDINCGKSIGVRTIGVGTGTSSKSVLEKENPDYYFDNLKNTTAVLQSIMEKI